MLASKHVKTFLFGVLSITIILVAVETFLFLSYFIVKSDIGEENNKGVETYEYQSLRMFPSGELSLGMVSIRDELDKDEYLFRTVEIDGSMTLISHLGKREYMCTGTCFCEEDGRRRSFSNSVTKRIPYLLVATTTASALMLSSRYYEDRCEMIMKEDCGQHTVHSEVEECAPILKSNDNINEGGMEEDDTFSSGPGEYWCKGHCIVRETFEEFRRLAEDIDPDEVDEEYRRISIQELEETYNYNIKECSKMSMEGSVKIDELGVEGRDPRIKFQLDQLHSMCMEGSKRSLIKDLEITFPDDMHTVKDKLRMVDMMIEQGVSEWATCVSHRNEEINVSIKCRKTS